MSPKPVRVASTSSYAFDIEDILQGKAQSGGDAAMPAISRYVCVGAKCIQIGSHLSRSARALDFTMSEARRQ